MPQPAANLEIDAGRRRVVIAGVSPEIDDGRFPAKRVIGDTVEVSADIFCDGHDLLRASLLHRHESLEVWTETPMEPLVNDRWRGRFAVTALGRYVFTIRAWVDHFGSWRSALQKKAAAGRDVTVELLEGVELIRAAAARATGPDADGLASWAARLGGGVDSAVAAALDPLLLELVRRYPDHRLATLYERELELVVERERGRSGAWYELFPRSTGAQGRHGTLRDAEARLPYVAGMGFDVVYLPPIHPIGRTHRKGRNNSSSATRGDVGSPWAIGGPDGGHTSVHPELGTLDDLHSFRDRAAELGLELALDIAFQCSPDHPWVSEHPEWFRHRPDGSIQYAENPPKRYEDIVPFDFETTAWPELWRALADVVHFWSGHGVRIFRVDNPHTKPFAFWEWLIDDVRSSYPDAVFLSEAFTRPKVMERLAKVGFSQSYTYFTWRNTKAELTDYLTHLTSAPVSDYLRPNLWPNTPDILPERLQTGGRPAFAARLVLAATLSAAYGVYGPAFELLEATPREPGSEEYLDSEKYEIKSWNLDDPASLADLIARVNRVRHDNPALQRNDTLRFHPTDNDALICYSKRAPEHDDVILAVVNLDPHHTHSGWLELDLDELDVEPERPFQVHDLLGDARFLWHGARNYVELDPGVMPAHLFRIRRRVRTERDFEYYL